MDKLRDLLSKILVISFIVLFLGTCITPSGAIENIKKSSLLIFSGNTFYVGGTGEGNYTRIQDAIDNTSNGDSIFVFNGIYYENVEIDKSINLIGENCNTTIIDGNYNWSVIAILADCVNITGFTIRKSGDGMNNAGLNICSNFSTIAGNNIFFNWYGIGSSYHNNNLIDNKISNNEAAIYLYSSKSNNIIGNNILNNTWGICLEDSENITIIGNIISDNIGGIPIENSNMNTIKSNIVLKNKISICLYYSNSNIIRNNNILNNSDGIYLLDSSVNSIQKNNFVGNERDASFYNSFRNQWKQNFWGNPRILPVIIIGSFGRYGRIPWFNIDWRPAKEPYGI